MYLPLKLSPPLTQDLNYKLKIPVNFSCLVKYSFSKHCHELANPSTQFNFFLL